MCPSCYQGGEIRAVKNFRLEPGDNPVPWKKNGVNNAFRNDEITFTWVLVEGSAQIRVVSVSEKNIVINATNECKINIIAFNETC